MNQDTRLDNRIIDLRVRIHGLLTKCEVEMAGYWASFFLLGVEVHKLAKKEQVQPS